MSNAFSRSFELREWKAWIINSPTSMAPDPVDPILTKDFEAFELASALNNKYVYVYQQLGTSDPTCILELFFDPKNGGLCRVEPPDIYKERDAGRPKPAPATTNSLVLAHTIQDKKSLHYFYVSRIRLPLASLKILDKTITDIVPATDLSDPKSFVLAAPTDLVGVTDAMKIAEKLHSTFEAARNGVLRKLAANVDNPKAEDVRIQHAKLILADTLNSLLSAGSGVAEDLALVLKTGEVRSYRTDLEGITLDGLQKVDSAAAPLCLWLDSKLYKFTMSTYFVFKDSSDPPAWLEHFAGVVSRLCESPVGLAYLTKALNDPDHLIHVYVIPSSPAPENISKAAVKAAVAVFNIFAELALAEIRRGTANELTNINNLVPGPSSTPMLSMVSNKQVADMRVDGKFTQVKSNVSSLEVVDGDGLARFSAEAGVQNVKRFAGQLVSVVNLGLSVKSIADAKSGLDKGVAVVAAFGSGAKVVASADVLLGLSNLTVKRLGMAAAMVDAATNIPAISKAAGTNDYSTAAGAGITIIGDALIAIGCYCATRPAAAAAATGDLPAALVLELAGAIVAAVGLIIKVFGEDSDLEIFAGHCYFGKNYGQGSGSKPWSQGAFQDWKDNFDRQVSVMYTLLAAFSAKPAKSDAVIVTLGYIQPPTILNAKFEFGWFPGGFKATRNTGVSIECGTRKAKSIGADPLASTTPNFLETAEGRLEVTILGKPATVPLACTDFDMSYVDCEVWLDLAGDGANLVPHSGNPVKFRVFDGKDLGKDVFSKDFS